MSRDGRDGLAVVLSRGAGKNETIEVGDMLPRMKLTDRITWSVLGWIFLNLLWLRFLEEHVPQWVGAVIATAAAAAFIVFGPRPEDEAEAESDSEEEISHKG